MLAFFDTWPPAGIPMSLPLVVSMHHDTRASLKYDWITNGVKTVKFWVN
jgi:hypothetical protein